MIAFIENIKERGVRDIGWWYNVFKNENFDLNWAFKLLQENHELIGDKGDISKLVDYFIDNGVYYDTLEKLEKNNGAEK